MKKAYHLNKINMYFIIILSVLSIAVYVGIKGKGHDLEIERRKLQSKINKLVEEYPALEKIYCYFEDKGKFLELKCPDIEKGGDYIERIRNITNYKFSVEYCSKYGCSRKDYVIPKTKSIPKSSELKIDSNGDYLNFHICTESIYNSGKINVVSTEEYEKLFTPSLENCKTINDIYDRYTYGIEFGEKACLHCLAQKTKNRIVCDMISSSAGKGYCIMDLARDNRSVCYELPEDNSSVLTKDGCLAKLEKIKEDFFEHISITEYKLFPEFKKFYFNVEKTSYCHNETGYCALDEYQLISYLEGQPVPAEIIQKGNRYLESNFGSDFFKENIMFNRSYTELFTKEFVKRYGSWVGCEEIISPNISLNGVKYILIYNLNMEKFIRLRNFTFVSDPSGNSIWDSWPTYKIRLVYTDSGEEYCSHYVVNCTGNAQYCPPFKINTHEKVIEEFNKRCKGDANLVVFSLGHVSISRPHWIIKRIYRNDSQTRYSWEVYMDSQTGKIIDTKTYSDEISCTMEN